MSEGGYWGQPAEARIHHPCEHGSLWTWIFVGMDLCGHGSLRAWILWAWISMEQRSEHGFRLASPTQADRNQATTPNRRSFRDKGRRQARPATVLQDGIRRPFVTAQELVDWTEYVVRSPPQLNGSVSCCRWWVESQFIFCGMYLLRMVQKYKLEDKANTWKGYI